MSNTWKQAGLKALALCFMLVPLAAQAWWQDAWSYRKKITLDGATLQQATGRMPVLVRLHSGNFSFADTREDGADLRFVDANDKTVYPHHIESFDPLLGIATVWVDVPDIAAGVPTDLWLYYGNPEAAAAEETASNFEAEYRLVYHFNQPAGTPPRDQTAYGNHSKDAGLIPVDAAIIGPGLRLSGQQPLTLPSSDSMRSGAGGGFTVSLWIKPDAVQPDVPLYARREAGAELLLGLAEGVPYVQVENAGQVQRSAFTEALAPALWSHLVVVGDKTGIVVYVNGRALGQLAATLPSLGTAAVVGGDVNGQPGFVGEIDELRVSGSARGAAQIAADFSTQGPESLLVQYGQDEQQSGHGGYFGVILKSVTLDAWVVIGILGVMGVISWYVMYTKGAYAAKVHAANDLFMEHFRKLGRDLLGMRGGRGVPQDERADLDDSSLFRLYEVGSAEIQSRFDDGQVHALSAESIEAIRAAMDATLVRENQRLSRSMVLLTIAISGGPFLGLLGTVVGVMITFAAIAAAGDVNVNAIAPGIAAALLATIAGLGVAIPALFGYNYLLGRNKNVTANMQVFVDEFVTRMAELYRGGRSHAHPL